MFDTADLLPTPQISLYCFSWSFIINIDFRYFLSSILTFDIFSKSLYSISFTLLILRNFSVDITSVTFRNGSKILIKSSIMFHYSLLVSSPEVFLQSRQLLWQLVTMIPILTLSRYFCIKQGNLNLICFPVTSTLLQDFCFSQGLYASFVDFSKCLTSFL